MMFVLQDHEIPPLDQLVEDIKRFPGFNKILRTIQRDRYMEVQVRYFRKKGVVKIVGNAVFADPPKLEIHLFMRDADRKRLAKEEAKWAKAEHVGDAGYTCPPELCFEGTT
jgi:hypothetical protein